MLMSPKIKDKQNSGKDEKAAHGRRKHNSGEVLVLWETIRCESGLV